MPEKRLTRQTVKIGFFTLLAIGILYLGITYLKGLSISARSKTYYVAMNDVTGINVATRVFVNGYKVGSVRKMDYDYRNNGETILTLTLDPDIKLPEGTQVQVAQTLFSGAGQPSPPRGRDRGLPECQGHYTYVHACIC